MTTSVLGSPGGGKMRHPGNKVVLHKKENARKIPSESRRQLMGSGEGGITVLESYKAKLSKVNLYFYRVTHSA